MLSLILALLGGASGPNFDELPIKEVQAYAQQAAVNLQPTMPQKIQIVVTERAEMTPLGSINTGPSSKSCVVVINSNPSAWRLWGRFTQYLDRDNWGPMIEASVAHEIGHCEERALNAKYAANVNSDAFGLVRGDASSRRSVNQTVSSHLASELYADVYAHLYVKKFLANKAQVVEQAWQQGRDQYANSDPEHATGDFLAKIKTFEAQRPEEESLAQAAWNLRQLSLQPAAGEAL